MSNNSWNSDYNSTKGSLLVGNGTRPVVRTVGTNGQVLTADSAQADGVNWTTPSGGPLVNMSPYIVGPTQSDFTTISAAIAQAVTDGASATNQYNILIKADTYVENITVPDGINLIGVDGFVGTPNFVGNAYSITNAATIQGNVTFTPGEMKIHNLNIFPVSGSSFTYNTAGNYKIQFRNLRVLANDSSAHISSTGATNLFLSVDASWFNPTTGPLFNITNSGAVAQVEFVNCLTGNGNSPSTINGQFFLEAYASNLGDAFDTTGSSLSTFYYNHCIVNTPVLPISTSGTNQTTVNLINSFVYSGNNIIDTSNTNSIFQATNTGFLSTLLYACPGNVSFANCGIGAGFGGNFQSEFFKISNPSTGAFQGSELYRTGNSIVTVNNTPTNILTIPSVADTSYFIRGQIIGSTDIPHTDSTGGTIEFVTNDNSGVLTIVGTVTTNVKATSTGTFNANVSGSNINITVTGLAATNYNWVGYFEYHKVIDSN